MIDGHWSHCYHCKCRMWIPQALYETAIAGAPNVKFYCAHGHGQVFKGQKQIHEDEQIRLERDRLKQSVAELEDSVRWHSARTQDAQKKLMAAAKDKARIAKRIHAGVCPDCNRTFNDLARHMHSKHKSSLSSDPLSVKIRPTLEKSQ